MIVYYSIPLFLAFGLYYTILRLRLDGVTGLLIGGGFALCLCFIYQTYWEDFSLDPGVNEAYIRYIAEHHALPPRDFNAITRHPPGYYALAALFYAFGTWAGGVPAIDYVRYLTLILYFTFLLFAVQFLRLQFPARERIYYLLLAMLLCWPVHCDALLYPAAMAVMYYLAVWLRTRTLLALTGAMWAASVALLAKNNAVVWYYLVTAICGGHLCYYRAQLRRKDIFFLALAFCFASFCHEITLTRDSVSYITETAPKYSLTDFIWMYGYFNPYEFIRDTMINPYSGEMFHFWHFFLRTLLLGDFIIWKALAVVFAFGIVWLFMILYIFYGFWRVKILPKPEKPMLLLVFLFLGLQIAMVAYFFAITPEGLPSADARYVYPVVTLVLLLYGKAMQWHRDAGRHLCYQIGSGVALGFITLSLILFTSQFFILTRIG